MTPYVDGLQRNFGSEGVDLGCARRAGATVAMCLLQRHSLVFEMWASFLPAQAEIGPSLIVDPALVPQHGSGLSASRSPSTPGATTARQ